MMKKLTAKLRPIKTFPLLGLSFLGTALCIISYYSLQRGFVVENKLSKYTGEVTYKGVITKTSPMTRDPQTGARERLTNDFFHVRLKGLAQTLETYNTEENYRELENAITLGDSITVLYESTVLYKIEKKGVLILESKGKRLREKLLGFITGIGAALVFWKIISMFRKTST